MSATENDFRSDVASVGHPDNGVGHLDKPRLAAGFADFRRDESGVADRNDLHPSEPTSDDHEEDAAPAETATAGEMWQ